MIYVTEQQVVVTAGTVVIVAGISFCLAWWAAYRRGWKHCEENQRWEREQAKARQPQPVWRRQAETAEDSSWEQWSPEAAHEAQPAWEEQALTLANEPPGPEMGNVSATQQRPARTEAGTGPGLPLLTSLDSEDWNGPPLEPTAVISPGEESTTAWTRRKALEMDAFLRDLIGGTDEQLREITR